MPPSTTGQDLGVYMAARFQEYTLFEAAGLFWIGAELAILFAIAEAHRYLRQDTLHDGMQFQPALLKRFSLYMFVFLLFCAPVIWAHWAQGSQDYVTRWSLRISIWCLFIVGWVVLESLIVLRGILTYNALRVRLGQQPLSRTAWASGTAVFLFFVLTLSIPLFYTTIPREAAPIELTSDVKTIAAFTQMIEPYENGKLLLLRVAGVVWISVEWVAAVVMCGAFYFLKRRVEA